eukprot:313746-Amphidinium_carterae.5
MALPRLMELAAARSSTTLQVASVEMFGDWIQMFGDCVRLGALEGFRHCSLCGAIRDGAGYLGEKTLVPQVLQQEVAWFLGPKRGTAKHVVAMVPTSTSAVDPRRCAIRREIAKLGQQPLQVPYRFRRSPTCKGFGTWRSVN